MTVNPPIVLTDSERVTARKECHLGTFLSAFQKGDIFCCSRWSQKSDGNHGVAGLRLTESAGWVASASKTTDQGVSGFRGITYW